MEEILSVLKDVGPTVKSIFSDILPQIPALGTSVLPDVITIIGEDHPVIRIAGIGLAVMILFILFMLLKPRKD
jgi:hypothetical protein